MKTETIRLYEGREDVTLTTYLLADSKEFRKGKPRPAVLICPGGAYLNLSDREAEPVAMKFLAMGYHAFILRYSVYSENGAVPFAYEAIPQPKKKTMHPNPVLEIAMAVCIIRERAKEWLVREDQLTLCGFSAGAHNCAMYAVYWNRPLITEHFKKDPETLRPNTLILGYPLTDYVYLKESIGKDPIQDGLFQFSNAAFLGCALPEEEVLVSVSPARLVTKDVPPTFIWATSNDGLVPVTHSLLMARALSEQNIPYELHIFEEGPHGLAAADQTSAEAITEVNPAVQKWIGMARDWLNRRFAYELPEKTDMELFYENMQNQ